MKSESFGVAVVWLIGAGLGQLVLVPFGMANGAIWLGIVLGATAQAVIFYCKPSETQ